MVTAVLDSSLPAVGAPADPRLLRDILQRGGLSVRMIGDGDLAALDAESDIGILVVPNAAAYPLDAMPALRRYLQRGGHLVALGGQAFSHLFARDSSGGWHEQTTIGDSLVPPVTDPRWVAGDSRRCSLQAVERGGQPVPALRMSVAREDLDESPGDDMEPGAEWTCACGPFQAGETYVLSALMKCEGVGGRHFAHFHWTYLRVEQADASGAVIHSALLDFEHPYLTGSEPWRLVAYRFWPDPKAARLSVKIGVKPGAYGTLWASDVALRREEWATTAIGMLCDGLHVLPRQVGCFDPGFRLEDVARVVTSGAQGVAPVTVDADADLEGFAAVASTGEEPSLGETHVGHPRTVRRVTPLLEALDAYGRPRGPVMSLVHNTSGFYEGSMWALMGVENADLVRTLPGVADMLTRVAAHMQHGVSLDAVTPGFSCYREGESISFDVSIRARGAAESVQLAFRIVDRAGVEVWSGERAVTLGARQSPERVSVSCGIFPLPSDLYRVVVSARCSGQEADRMEAGFSVWKPALQAGGRSVGYAANYFTIDGRPTLICGTKGGVFWLDGHLSEDPLAWDAECASLRDNGLSVYGMVGLSQWITLGMAPAERESMLRRLDARVQICHAHGIVPFIDLQFHPVAGVDRAAEIAYAAGIAERYRGLRSLFFYVTGDINIPLSDDPEMQESFHRFLAAKYESDRALADAWGAPAARRDEASVTPMKAYWQRKPWRDVRAANLHEFRNEFLRAWLAKQAAALREVTAGEGTRLITAEFWSDQQLDQWNASTGLDFSAMGIGLGQRRYMHQYDAPMLSLADMRMDGQSFTIGEFGTQVHPAFDHAGYSWSDAEGKLDRFSMVVHHAFGRGGSMIATWDAADLDYYVFPWGLMYSDRRVPKRILSAYRNYNLFFRRLRPAWHRPDVLLVLPDENRRSGNFHVVNEALFNAARLLLHSRVDFSAINDGGLARVKNAPRALFYPIPFCPSDDVTAQLYRLAEAGAHVYISGDFSLGPSRQRTREARLSTLAGVRFERELRPGISRAGPVVRMRSEPGPGRVREYSGKPCIQVQPLDAEVTWRDTGGRATAFRRPLGRGAVHFSTDPIELFSIPEDAKGNRERREVYGDVTRAAGVSPHEVGAEDDVESFRLPLEDGGEAFLFYCNRPGGGPAADVSLRRRGRQLTFQVGPCRGGALVFGADGALTGWEGRGTLTVDGTPWLEAGCDLLVYSADAAPIVAANCLVVLPLGPGGVRLHRAGAACGAVAAEVGEVTAGAWRTLRALTLERAGAGAGASVRWSALDARGMVLVGTPAAVAEAARGVAAELHR